MRDIVNVKFIIKHQEEILKTGDVIPKSIMRYIDSKQIEKYFKYNQKDESFNYDSVKEWVESEKLYLFTDLPEDIIDLLVDWVDCYPQFEQILNKEAFEEYIENDGVLHQPELDMIEKRFHGLIMERSGFLIEKFKVRLPHITQDLLKTTDWMKPASFPVPGMYGEFYYSLGIDRNFEYFLNVDSWFRICEGSGQTHKITTKACELIDEGFV